MEAAAYFAVAEALTNAARYSGATAVEVAATDENGRLRVVVSDNGCGGADLLGSGLGGIADRVAAVDGTLSVRSPRGRGHGDESGDPLRRNPGRGSDPQSP